MIWGLFVLMAEFTFVAIVNLPFCLLCTGHGKEGLGPELLRIKQHHHYPV